MAYVLECGNFAVTVHYYPSDCSRILKIFRKLKVNRTASYCIANVFENDINLHKNCFGKTSHLSHNCTFITGGMVALLKLFDRI